MSKIFELCESIVSKRQGHGILGLSGVTTIAESNLLIKDFLFLKIYFYLIYVHHVYSDAHCGPTKMQDLLELE